MLLEKVILLDGGMGSELNRLSLPTEIPEDLNITNPEDIKAIHKSYSDAGSDYITTNTFGLNRIKYHGNYSIEEVAKAAIDNARSTGRKVLFDIGPTGLLMSPMGSLTFDDAYETFKEIVVLTNGLVDGYILETFSDLYEIKAAILAVKENSDSPIFATMTFDETGRTLMGSTPEIVSSFLTNMSVDYLGINCSLGPKELIPLIKRMRKYTNKPLICQPNRGIPEIVNFKARYKMTSIEYKRYMSEVVELGVSVIGGCCGTTPEFIESISCFKGMEIEREEIIPRTIVSSSRELVEIDGVRICGERLNPTGKKKLKAAIIENNIDYLIDEALKQKAESDLLDINLGVPGVDEALMMKNVIPKIQEYIDLPLQIDSSNKDALETGLRYYNGIPLLNSVNADIKVLESILPIAKKYGAVVLGLTMDESGIPRSAEERLEKAKTIKEYCNRYGIGDERIIIDTLTLTVSAEQDLVKETLRSLDLVRNMGLKTALGVSNVSFGLPERPIINKTFLSMAMAMGLNMPIMNPLDTEMVNAVYSYNALMGYDSSCEKYVERFSGLEKKEEKRETNDITLYDSIKEGLKEKAKILAKKELEKSDPLTIINDILVKALNEVGDLYQKGAIYLPQLMKSAEAAKECFSIIKTKFAQTENNKKRVLLATVKGDVHDIGKNICRVVLESYGYECIDIGKDTPIESVIDAYRKYNPDIIGLSALMTTTVKSMEDTIKELRKMGCKARIYVGGAVLSADIAESIGADVYSKDALEFVNLLEEE